MGEEQSERWGLSGKKTVLEKKDLHHRTLNNTDSHRLRLGGRRQGLGMGAGFVFSFGLVMFKQNYVKVKVKKQLTL